MVENGLEDDEPPKLIGDSSDDEDQVMTGTGANPASSPAPSTPVDELQWQAVPRDSPFWATENPIPQHQDTRRVSFAQPATTDSRRTRTSSPTRFQRPGEGILRNPQAKKKRLVTRDSDSLPTTSPFKGSRAPLPRPETAWQALEASAMLNSAAVARDGSTPIVHSPEELLLFSSTAVGGDGSTLSPRHLPLFPLPHLCRMQLSRTQL